MNLSKHKILIIDDEVEFLDLLEEILSAEGYETVRAVNGEEALEKLEQHGSFSLIISDHKMPVMTGTDFLQVARKLVPNVPRIIITAYQNTDMMEDSINRAEVFRFLTKPINIGKLLGVVKTAIQKFEKFLKEEEKNKERDMLIRQITQAIEESPPAQDRIVKDTKKDPLENGEIKVDMFEMLAALSTALDIINPALNNIQKRTCYIASSLAEALNLPTNQVSSVFMASIMHDIGAIALTDRFKFLEFEEQGSHGHAELGALLLQSFPPFADFATIVRYHHVQWEDGAGQHSEGIAVPPLSHLICLADRIAVLIKNDVPIFNQVPSIVEKIVAQSGRRFVPEYVEAFRHVSKQEAFWLDVISSSLDDVLREKSQLPEISLNLNGVEELARFFSNIVDTRSHFTANHSSGVAACAEEIGMLMGMGVTNCQEMKIAGYLHDLGKLAVPNSILEKPEKLNGEEKSVIKGHTYHTHSILRRVAGLENIVSWASFHHETLTGDGYPFHRNAEGLALGSRILSVADIFTALNEDRPYRKGMEKPEVEKIFSNMTDEGRIDRSIVAILMGNFERVNEVRVEAQKAQNNELLRFWKKSEELSKELPQSRPTP